MKLILSIGKEIVLTLDIDFLQAEENGEKKSKFAISSLKDSLKVKRFLKKLFSRAV